MDLRQLRYLVALSEERNFTRAAEREHIAQPALSQQIRKLEQSVGLPLVQRTTRRVAMTEAGNLLVARARRILAELDAANAELQSLVGVQTGHVTVGTIHTMGPIDVSLALAIFHERHPRVELTIREHSSDELAEMLRIDQLDLAFLSVTEPIESHGLALMQLVSEELVVVLPVDHRLAGRRRRCAWLEPRREQFISYRAGRACASCCSPPGTTPASSPRSRSRLNESQRIQVGCGQADGGGSAPIDAQALRRRGRDGGADRAVAVPRHHAGVARGSPPVWPRTSSCGSPKSCSGRPQGPRDLTRRDAGRGQRAGASAVPAASRA